MAHPQGDSNISNLTGNPVPTQYAQNTQQTQGGNQYNQQPQYYQQHQYHKQLQQPQQWHQPRQWQPQQPQQWQSYQPQTPQQWQQNQMSQEMVSAQHTGARSACTHSEETEKLDMEGLHEAKEDLELMGWIFDEAMRNRKCLKELAPQEIIDNVMKYPALVVDMNRLLEAWKFSKTNRTLQQAEIRSLKEKQPTQQKPRQLSTQANYPAAPANPIAGRRYAQPKPRRSGAARSLSTGPATSIHNRNQSLAPSQPANPNIKERIQWVMASGQEVNQENLGLGHRKRRAEDPIPGPRAPWKRVCPTRKLTENDNYPKNRNTGKINNLILNIHDYGVSQQEDLCLCYGIYWANSALGQKLCPNRDHPELCPNNHGLSQIQLNWLVANGRIDYHKACYMVERHNENCTANEPLLDYPPMPRDAAGVNRGSMFKNEEDQQPTPSEGRIMTADEFLASFRPK